MTGTRSWLAVLTLALGTPHANAEIERVWLTHSQSDPSTICVNWQTDEPGESIVHFGDDRSCPKSTRTDEATTLHHVNVAFSGGGDSFFYKVQTGADSSDVFSVSRYVGAELRIAVVADWQGRPDLARLIQDRPHLLVIAGDQVTDLHGKCGVGVRDCVKPFAELVDKYRELFRSVPVMPVLGNHDREIRPRGKTPPAEACYDIEATAWRAFYPTPGDGWKWRFDIPEYSVRLIALDLQHTSDLGTTWQTGHDFRAGSPQLNWYRDEMSRADGQYVITVHNERNATMRGYEKGEWHRLFSAGSATVSGFGYFAERAVVENFPYFNTALGTGAKYADPQSKFFASEPSYLLLTWKRNASEGIAELKSLTGTVLDRSAVSRAPAAK
jgi:hypothetical protein